MIEILGSWGIKLRGTANARGLARAHRIRDFSPYNIKSIFNFYNLLQTKEYFHPVLFQVGTNRTAIVWFVLFCLSSVSILRTFLRKFRLPYYMAVVSRMNDEIIGFAYLLVKGTNASLAIAVSDYSRRVGVGSELIGGLMSQAYDIGVEWIGLIVQQRNTPAVNLFRKNGFEVVGATLDIYKSKKYPSLFMRKSMRTRRFN